MYDLANAHSGDLVHLEIGEPDFDTPDHIVEAAATAIREGATHYTSNAGLPELRDAIRATTRQRHGFDLTPDEEIVVTSGAMEALLLAMECVVDPGQRVLIPTPAWPNYWTQVALAEGKPASIPLSEGTGFSLDPIRIIEAMDETTAAIVLTTPSNPTGQVYDQDAVRAVVEAAADQSVYVIADEVYSSLIYDEHPTGIAGYTDAQEWVLTVESCSKQYAMTGWRVGWLAGPADVIAAATKLRESTTACTANVSQHAAIAALTGPQEPAAEMKDAFRERRDYVVDRINAMSYASCPRPEGAFYAFVDISDLEGTSLDVAKRLLYDYGVVTAPGGGFGAAGEGFLRLSFANSLERLEIGLDRFEKIIADELST